MSMKKLIMVGSVVAGLTLTGCGEVSNDIIEPAQASGSGSGSDLPTSGRNTVVSLKADVGVQENEVKKDWLKYINGLRTNTYSRDGHFFYPHDRKIAENSTFSKALNDWFNSLELDENTNYFTIDPFEKGTETSKKFYDSLDKYNLKMKKTLIARYLFSSESEAEEIMEEIKQKYRKDTTTHLFMVPNDTAVCGFTEIFDVKSKPEVDGVIKDKGFVAMCGDVSATIK